PPSPFPPRRAIPPWRSFLAVPGCDALDVKRRVAVLECLPEPLRFGPTVPRRLHPLVGQRFSHGGIELPRVSHVRHGGLPGERARPAGPTDGQRVSLAIGDGVSRMDGGPAADEGFPR